MSLEKEKESFSKVVTENIMVRINILSNDPNFKDKNDPKRIEFNEELGYYGNLLRHVRSSSDIQQIIYLKKHVYDRLVQNRSTVIDIYYPDLPVNERMPYINRPIEDFSVVGNIKDDCKCTCQHPLHNCQLNILCTVITSQTPICTYCQGKYSLI